MNIEQNIEIPEGEMKNPYYLWSRKENYKI